MVEYKHESAPKQRFTNPSYQALIDLGNRAVLPVFVCRYKDDFTLFRVLPLNEKAREWLPCRKDMNEREYVTFLYRMRGYEVPQSMFERDGEVI